VSLGGYILTKTKLKDIPDARDMTREEVKRDCPILRQEGNYLNQILGED
jgi:hypothetical protein